MRIIMYYLLLGTLTLSGVLYVFKAQATDTIPAPLIASAVLNEIPEQPEPAIQREKRILEGLTIMIDPGHGGRDIGATGLNGTIEKNVTLQTAKRIREVLLDKTGATVILTREGDESLSLEERVDKSREKSTDLFISLHYDAYTKRDVAGITTYYCKEEDWYLANVLHEHLFKQDMHTRDRGVGEGNYHVLRENVSPSVLLELGYISNQADEERINSQEFQDQVATALVEGILDYFSL